VRRPAARQTHWTFDVKTARCETINTLFYVVNFLKCVVTEVVLLLFRHWHFTRLCSDTFEAWWDILWQYYYKCSHDSESKIILKIDQYLMKLRRTKLMHTKKVCQFFGPPCIYVSWSCEHSLLIRLVYIVFANKPTFVYTLFLHSSLVRTTLSQFCIHDSRHE